MGDLLPQIFGVSIKHNLSCHHLVFTTKRHLHPPTLLVHPNHTLGSSPSSWHHSDGIQLLRWYRKKHKSTHPPTLPKFHIPKNHGLWFWEDVSPFKKCPILGFQQKFGVTSNYKKTSRRWLLVKKNTSHLLAKPPPLAHLFEGVLPWPEEPFLRILTRNSINAYPIGSMGERYIYLHENHKTLTHSCR